MLLERDCETVGGRPWQVRGRLQIGQRSRLERNRAQDGNRLVAVVELVSPSNKARPDARRGFAGKCAAYLHRGIGLVVIDVVTARQSNLHNELLDVLGQPDTPRMPEDASLYANAYRPVNQKENGRIDVWTNALTVGGNLPTVPLALKGAWPIPLDLEARYGEARERARL